MNSEAFEQLPPAACRQVMDQAAREGLFPFLAHIHPVVAPEAKFIDALHLRAITHACEQVVRGEIRRLAIAVPPRHFKSGVASVALPVWALGLDPSTRVICASYGNDLAKTFADKSRSALQSDSFRRLFPNLKLRSKNPAWDRLNTTAGGYRMATSVGGVLTGEGAHLAIVDDPMKASDAQSRLARDGVYNWFKGTLMSRFDKPAQSKVIVVMQRLHQDDLVGRLLQEEGWDYLKLPGEAQEEITIPVSDKIVWTMEPGRLLFPEHFNRAALKQQQIDLGESAYNAQVLQAPSPPGGAMIKMKWFKRYETLPLPHQIELVVQVWDTALADSQTADFSVCTTWGVSGQKLYLMDCYRRQMPYHELEKAVLAQHQKHKANYVFVEKAGTGITLFQNLRQLRGLDWFMAIPPVDGKVARMAQQAPKIERGRVYLPNKASWLEPFEHEIAEFPYGRHDDQVDSLAYFLRLFDHGRSAVFRELSMFSGWEPGTPVL